MIPSSSLGVGDKWDSVIYPGMRQALIHVLQVTQDAIEYRKVRQRVGLLVTTNCVRGTSVYAV